MGRKIDFIQYFSNEASSKVLVMNGDYGSFIILSPIKEFVTSFLSSFNKAKLMKDANKFSCVDDRKIWHEIKKQI